LFITRRPNQAMKLTVGRCAASPNPAALRQTMRRVHSGCTSGERKDEL
jgi:hypothetical protein